MLQVGVVSQGQSFPFWVSPQASLLLRVSLCQPGPVVRLGLGCEVEVAPRLRARPAPASAADRPVPVDGAPSSLQESTARTAAGASQQGLGSAAEAVAVWLRLQVGLLQLFDCGYRWCCSCLAVVTCGAATVYRGVQVVLQLFGCVICGVAAVWQRLQLGLLQLFGCG